jgi:tetratricopeptide (TPR) repeat protein
MAESCAVAFGRYLRMLRERRGLSLDDVATMSRSLADPVDKSYLSRCENGHYGIGFSKAITLSRIYGVPTEVLAERLELDTELDRIGGPDTSGLTHGELQKRGVAASNRGAAWDAYTNFRDSVHLALRAELSPTFRDAEEQHLIACMNVSTAAGRLGRSRFSVHELEYIRAAAHLGPGLEPLLLDLLSWRYRVLGELEKARGLADEAVTKAEEDGSASARGYAYANRARLACHEKDFRKAISLYQIAFKAHEQAGRINECANTLLNLANAYVDSKRRQSAQRALAAAERLALSVHDTRTRVLIRVLGGELSEAEGLHSEATRRWHEALELARSLNDKILQFKAEFYLYRHALRREEEATARALGRRLLRLAAWIPADLEELAQFRELSGNGLALRRTRVPAPQH